MTSDAPSISTNAPIGVSSIAISALSSTYSSRYFSDRNRQAYPSDASTASAALASPTVISISSRALSGPGSTGPLTVSNARSPSRRTRSARPARCSAPSSVSNSRSSSSQRPTSRRPPAVRPAWRAASASGNGSLTSVSIMAGPSGPGALSLSQLHELLVAAPEDHDADRPPRLDGAEQTAGLVGARDVLALNRDDDVALFDVGFGRGPRRRHARDVDAAAAGRKPEIAPVARRQILNAHAESRVARLRLTLRRGRTARVVRGLFLRQVQLFDLHVDGQRL